MRTEVLKVGYSIFDGERTIEVKGKFNAYLYEVNTYEFDESGDPAFVESAKMSKSELENAYKKGTGSNVTFIDWEACEEGGDEY